MDESKNQGNVFGAVFGVVLIFLVLLYLLYKFGTNHQSVTNPDVTDQDYKTQLTNQFASTDPDSDIYNKYLKEIYDAQRGNSDQNVNDIVANYQTELVTKTAIPQQNISLENVSKIYDHKTYSQNFENLFADLKKNGGTAESRIFTAQISTSTDSLMPLADYDKQTLLRIASDYEIFSDNLLKLNTPVSDAAKALEVAKDALNIAYILRQMSQENDQKIYTVWITKYAENISAIITLRYALQ